MHYNSLWVHTTHTKNARFLSWIHTNLTDTLYSSLFRSKSGTLFQTSWLCVRICYMNLTSASVVEHIIFCIYCNIIINIQWMWMAAAAISCSSATTLYNRRQPMASTLLYQQRQQGRKKKKFDLSVPFLTDHSSITYQWCYIINSTAAD